MLLLLSLFALSQTPFGDRPMILDGAPDSSASEFVFITTPTGIRQFNRNTGTWTVIRPPGSPTGFIGLNGDSLWVITPKGAASVNVRGGRWHPRRIPGRVRCLAFTGDRFWAGGDSGLQGLNLRTGASWQRAEFAVNDMVYRDGRLWIASDAGAFRYDLKSDLIGQLTERRDSYDRVVATPGRVWFLSDRSFIVHLPDKDSNGVFGGVPIGSYSSKGDSVFLVSRGGVFLYTPASGKWVELADTLPLRGMEAVSVENGSVWFANSIGLYRYSLSDTARQVWTRAANHDDPPLALHADPRFVYMVSRRSIQVLDRKQDTWTVVSLSEPRRFFDFLKPRR
jgi:ligand-binding sensor domain-containing protein